MRIMQAIAGRNEGGAERFFTRLAIALAEIDSIEQMILMRPHERWLSQIEDAGLPVSNCKFGGIFDFRSRHLFKKKLDNFRPDIVVNWMSRATKYCPPGKWKKVARLGGYYPLKYYRGCDALIGNTKGICDYLISSGVPHQNVFHIPNFAETSVHGKNPDEQNSLSNKPRTVLAIGRLHKNKGFDTLLHAIKSLPELKLVLAGSGPEEGRLKRMAIELGLSNRVDFLGWVDDPTSLFQSVDLFVCPSRVEPLGNVILEAWVNHCPIVSSRSAGGLELIEDEVQGLLFDIEDADGLVRQISRILDDDQLSNAMTTAGFEKYEENFSKSAVLEKYHTFFREIIA